jgi:hypothetical protein
MNITLSQYILNPQIRSGAVLNSTAREAIRGAYVKKYDAILLRERGNINYTLYYDKKNNRYYAHFKIPSEVVSKFYYDTVLEFYTDSDIGNTEDLFKYYTKFYSNDPAFVYTHAHAFKANDLFITELSSKMSKEALKVEAKEKNPYNQIGYVKSIYFAYLTMKAKGLNDTKKFKAEAKKYSKIVLLSNIEDADKKVKDREDKGRKIQKQKSYNKSRVIDKATDTTVNSTKINKTKVINSVKTTNKVKTVKKRK